LTDSIYLLAVFCAVAAVAEWLGRLRAGRWLGGAIISLLLGILLANVGLIPTVANAPPLYGYLIAIGAPVAIFLLLLDVRLQALKRAGLPMLVAFGIGALGTLVGVATAFWLTNADEWLGRFAAPVGGMYAATYIGGSANLSAVALHYGVTDEPALFAATNVADSVVGTLWIAALVILAQLLHRMLGTRPEPAVADADPIEDPRPISLVGVGVLLALALGSLWLSQRLAAWTAGSGAEVPAMLILTTIALLVAHIPAVHRLGGARMLGVFGAYLFLAVVGASCDLETLAGLGRVGGLLVLFVVLVLLIHGFIQFGVGRLLRLSPEILAIASSANVGGTLTVMPIAAGLRRMDLLLPGILVGSLGNAIGTYAGFLMAGWLQSGPTPISAAQAIPPPPVQGVADCERPTYASDQLVCGDAELLALDRELGNLLAAVDLTTRVVPASLVESQEAWFRRRSLCAFSERHADCLKAAYAERIAVMTEVGQAATAATERSNPAACRDAPWGSFDVLVRGTSGETATVLDGQTRVLAVAIASARGSDWSPFVRFAADGAANRFTTRDGTTFECRIRSAD
jgi:uncharacterized membrane protein/uncharacterized protein YecT (DUF1311 family)